jgi:hypothetical protein
MDLAVLFMGLFGLGFWGILLGLVLLAFLLAPAVILLLWFLSMVLWLLVKVKNLITPNEEYPLPPFKDIFMAKKANTETAKRESNPVTEGEIL